MRDRQELKLKVKSEIATKIIYLNRTIRWRNLLWHRFLVFRPHHNHFHVKQRLPKLLCHWWSKWVDRRNHLDMHLYQELWQNYFFDLLVVLSYEAARHKIRHRSIWNHCLRNISLKCKNVFSTIIVYSILTCDSCNKNGGINWHQLISKHLMKRRLIRPCPNQPPNMLFRGT